MKTTTVEAHEILMGDTIVLQGALYTVIDEPTYVRPYAVEDVMVRLPIRAVPNGLRTGVLRGPFNVWAWERIPRVDNPTEED